MAATAPRHRIGPFPGARRAWGIARIALPGLAMSLIAIPARASCPSSCPAPASWGQPFSFAGFTWERKSGCGGPGPNCWAPEHAALVAPDGLHLRLARAGGRWFAGEIRTTQPVGYGDYAVQVVGRPDLLDPNVVLGIFLYDDDGAEAGEACPGELDMESGRFGDPLAPNGHAVTYVPGTCSPADLYDFGYALTGTHTTHQLRWGPGMAALRWLHGHRCEPDSPEQVIAERRFDSPRVPEGGRMRLHINLWAFAGQPPGDHQDVEVVIRDIVTGCVVADAGVTGNDPGPALAVRPNPARREADVWFELPREERVQVTVVDVSGRRVATLAEGVLAAGRHQRPWAAGDHGPGVYFVRLVVGASVVSRRMVLLE